MSDLSKSERDKIPTSDFGIPSRRAFPLDKKERVESAVHLFGKASKSEQPALARKILSKAKSYGIDSSGWDTIHRAAQEASEAVGITVNEANRIAALIRAQVIRTSKPPTGNQNCQLCTWCAEAQFRGINALPRPIYSPRDSALEIDGETIVKNPQQVSIDNKRDLIQKVMNTGLGARFYCHVKWNNGNGGHEFLLLNLDEGIYVMDAQQGYVDAYDSKSSSSYFNDIDYSKSYIARLDDKEFNQSLFDEMNDESKTIEWDPDIDIPYMQQHDMTDKDEQPTSNTNIYTRKATKEDERFIFFCELETIPELDKKDPVKIKETEQDAKDSIEHTEIIMDKDTGSKIGILQAYETDQYGDPDGTSKDWFYIADIYIIPEYRGKGIGSQILKPLLDSHKKILLMVLKENPRAKSLYEKLGFKVSEEYNNPPRYIMRLEHSITQESFMDEYEPDKIESDDKETRPTSLTKQMTFFGKTFQVDVSMIDYSEISERDESVIDRLCENINQLLIDARVKNELVGWMTDDDYYPNDVEPGSSEEMLQVMHDCKYPFVTLTPTHIYINMSTEKPCRYLVNCDWTYDIEHGYGFLFDEDGEYYASGPQLGGIDWYNMESYNITQEGASHNVSAQYKMRAATESDLEFVYQSELETVGENKNDPKVQKYIRKDVKESLGHTKIIVMNDADIGVYQAYETNYDGRREGKRDWWYLAHIYIKPKYRNLGIGSDIIKNDIKNHDKILLQVMKSNTSAKKLYESLGFVVDMENDHGGLVMRIDKSKSKAVHESTNIFESGHFAKYKDNVLGFNDDGMAVMKRCDCGGNISIAMKGEPVYTCESCGKTYGCVPCNVQEGAIQESLHNTIKGYRFTYNGIGIYEALKQAMFKQTGSSKAWNDFKKSDACSWLPVPPSYGKNNESYFTKFGYDTFKEKTLPIVRMYIPDFDETESSVLSDAIVYKDKYQFVIDASRNVIQEGAFQDIKNGVNPYSDDLVFHVSMDKHIDGQVWKPRVPDYLDPYNPEDTGFEDNTTPRICFSTSIEGCLNGITVNLQRQSPDTFDKMYVYVPEKPWKEYKHKTNKQLVKDKLVYDANVTREVWIMEPVRMKLYGGIRVDQIADAKRKSVVPTSKGQKDTRNYFTYRWHWVVKPNVLKKATKFDYSTERVIDDLCNDIKKFKYGLIRDGRLMTGNVSDADYNKYWVFHSGETVDQAGGGNCYDMVEYEAGYLEAFGVTYKKYFMNFTDTKNTKTLGTHTICVVPHNGKFIYIEQAFKRVVDEWGNERKKEFDKLTDIFEYVAEVSAEYENQDLNYGVWDYTDAEIDYGTPIKNFMEWIMTQCKMIHDGEASISKPEDEVYEECDWFVQLGDSMFYVSEYHNALFDDPDAHDEAINEFGILLDSYDDEIVQEAAYGPYDEYLKKHKYDPKTNTIEDPDEPLLGRRVSAGRIGSNKERNRMNKFLRENGYDPKTETIQTDINDPKNKGSKKRIKFTMNPHQPDMAWLNTSDIGNKQQRDFRNTEINLTPRTIQGKPSQSNYVNKHEEGHINQFANYGDLKKRSSSQSLMMNGDTTGWFEKPTSKEDKFRMRSAKLYIDRLKSSGKAEGFDAHDLDPKEYDSDAYAATHNPYDRKGTAGRDTLRKIGKRSIGMELKSDQRDVDECAKIISSVVSFDVFGKPGCPTDDDDYGTWAKFLMTHSTKPQLFRHYLEFDKLNTKHLEMLKRIDWAWKREPDREQELIRQAEQMEKQMAKYAKDKSLDEAEKIIRACQKYYLFKAYLNKHGKIDISKSDAVSGYMGGLEARGDFYQKHYDKQQKAVQAEQAKKRQLSKEQLKQQIASGKLNREQLAKAQHKLQRIEQFEKSQRK